MKTFNTWIATHPFAKGEEIYNAGILEGEMRCGLCYSRDDVQQWRNAVAEAAAQIAKRHLPENESTHLVNDILALRAIPLGKSTFEPRYSVKKCLPVCDLTIDSFGVPVAVWVPSSGATKPIKAFYGMRANDPLYGVPQFYYAGAVLQGVTEWCYREEE